MEYMKIVKTNPICDNNLKIYFEENKILLNLPNCVAENNRKSKQCPWQVRRQEIQNAKEIHADEWISSGPHVNQHYRKCLTQK